KSFDKSLSYWLNRKKDEEDTKGFSPPWVLNKIKGIGRDRKVAISNSKTNFVKKILNTKLRFKRTVVFCGSVDQCIELGGNNFSIHYKNKKERNEEIVENFNKGGITHLFTNKIGKEGMNFNNIECVLIIQVSSGKDSGLEFIQKSGR